MAVYKMEIKLYSGETSLYGAGLTAATKAVLYPTTGYHRELNRSGSLTLPVVHIVDSGSVYLPGEMNGDEAENEPAEQYFKYGHPHIIGHPIFHELGEERHHAVHKSGRELEIPRFVHFAKVSYKLNRHRHH